jgi:hypothetical protein
MFFSVFRLHGSSFASVATEGGACSNVRSNHPSVRMLRRATMEGTRLMRAKTALDSGPAAETVMTETLSTKSKSGASDRIGTERG